METSQNTPETTQDTPIERNSKPTRGSWRNSLTLKICFIAIIMLLLLIPGGMVTSLIYERGTLSEQAQEEVGRMWSGVQHITGPVVAIPYRTTVINTGTGVRSVEERTLTILPEQLEITGGVETQKLHRGLYDALVYTTQMTLEGEFALLADIGRLLGAGSVIAPERASVSLGISDLRGIEHSIAIQLDGRDYPTFNSGRTNCFDSGIAAAVDLSGWTADTSARKVSFKIDLKLKGSQSLYIAPTGEQTSIELRGDCATPSFIGNFLPSAREVNDEGFSAEWHVTGLNRGYPQAFTDNISGEVTASELGVKLLVPVPQYQQATRATKYAVLIILLTFIGVLFVEMTQHRNIHLFQYLLVGLALVLFYSLLISLSEHTPFGWAYLIAAAMTTAMIAIYIYGITRIRRTALCIGGMLALLYTYVYVLLQMESYALLAGSIGLFVILAVIMHYSLKMEWHR